MAAYWTALVLSLGGALWLVPGARFHVLTLSTWTALALLADAMQRYEMKLFLDFFGFAALSWLLLWSIGKGSYRESFKYCALLAFAGVCLSAVAYGVAIGFAGFYLPYETFSMLLDTHGFGGNAVFLLSVWVLFLGVNIRERAVHSLGRLRRALGVNSGLFAGPKAYLKAIAILRGQHDRMGTGVQKAGCRIQLSATQGARSERI